MNFRGKSLRNAKFINTDLTGANFENCNLIDTDFTNSNLNGTYFMEATLLNTNLTNSTFLPRRCTGAHFIGVDFSGCSFTKAGYSTNLQEVDISSCYFTTNSINNPRLWMHHVTTQNRAYLGLTHLLCLSEHQGTQLNFKTLFKLVKNRPVGSLIIDDLGVDGVKKIIHQFINDTGKIRRQWIFNLK